jgi:hypothetical protein
MFGHAMTSVRGVSRGPNSVSREARNLMPSNQSAARNIPWSDEADRAAGRIEGARGYEFFSVGSRRVDHAISRTLYSLHA